MPVVILFTYYVFNVRVLLLLLHLVWSLLRKLANIMLVGVPSSNILFMTYIIIDVQTAELSIQLLSERPSSDRVTAVLEWALSTSLIQYQQLLQNISVSIVPDSGVEMLLLGNKNVQVTLLYNTLYNVSIVQPATCEQLSQVAFIELIYGNSKL